MVRSDLHSGREAVRNLIERYRANRDAIRVHGSTYNESQLRLDYIDPLLSALGWDVGNHQEASQFRREVIVEEQIEVDGSATKKKPDYTVRFGGERRFFVEAKKPSVDVVASATSAFQTRRYGWSAGCPVSILTNFESFSIYDCTHKPVAAEGPQTARIETYRFDELADRFDEIHSILSYEAVVGGLFEARFAQAVKERKGQSFDSVFLSQIESWRLLLAKDLHARNKRLGEDEINTLVQQLINKIVFLRICEDRENIERGSLSEVKNYDELKVRFKAAEVRYNSGLFDLVESGSATKLAVGSDALLSVFKDLYYPHSPYDFAVVESAVLGEIYEQFLAHRIMVGDEVIMVQKPEIAASDGVVTTPRQVVDRIVDEAVSSLLDGMEPDGLDRLQIVDPACGSGMFLLSVYERLLRFCLEWYSAQGGSGFPIYEDRSGTPKLTLWERKRILTSCVFGVDIDPYAVEVAKFSLLLKVLEDLEPLAIDEELSFRRKALPNINANVVCGNSLVGPDFASYDPDSIKDGTLVAVNPLDWRTAFPQVFALGGFSAVIGNPPYIRIQNMVQYAPREVLFFQRKNSEYKTATQKSFDKYYLFLEKSLGLLRPGGRVGMIVSQKFTTIKTGKPLRRILTEGSHVSKIVHFGVAQVFPQRSTYTCILILAKDGSQSVEAELVQDLNAWTKGESGTVTSLQAAELTGAPWVFVPPDIQRTFMKARHAPGVVRLGNIAPPYVGIQTSNDGVYVIPSGDEDADYVYKTNPGKTRWAIERGILKPFLNDVSLLPFGTVKANAHLIFPYRMVDGRPEPLTESELKDAYPHCWEYLNAHKEELAKRSVHGLTPETWTRFGRSQNLRIFGGDARSRLVVRVLTLEPIYALDTAGTVISGGGNGPYYAIEPVITDLSPLYLMAILSHPVIEGMVRSRTSRFRGGYYSHGKQFLEDLPIRILSQDVPDECSAYDAIVSKAGQVMATTEAVAKARTNAHRDAYKRTLPMLRLELDALVSAIYGLDVAETEAVRTTDFFGAHSGESEE